jgi:hypothetical protein
MTYVDEVTATAVVPVPVIQNPEKFRDLTYLVAFVVVGLLVSTMSLVISSTEWLPEGAITVALASAG